MLGASCSPCCGCRGEYDLWLPKSCTVTLGGDVPTQDNVFIYGIYGSFQLPSGMPQVSRSPTVNYGSNAIYPSPISSPGINYSGQYPTCQPALTSQPFNRVVAISETSNGNAVGEAFKASQSVIGSHSLALDMSQTSFDQSAGNGVVSFVKMHEDYDVRLTIGILRANQCQPTYGLSVTTYARDLRAPFVAERAVERREIEQTATFTQQLADSLPYIFGRPVSEFHYLWCPGQKRRVVYGVVAPYYSFIPFPLKPSAPGTAQYTADAQNISNYSPVWDTVPDGIAWRRRVTYSAQLGLSRSSDTLFTYSGSAGHSFGGVAKWVAPGAVSSAFATAKNVAPVTEFEFFEAQDPNWGNTPTLGATRPAWPFDPAEKQLAYVRSADGVTSASVVLS